LALPDKIRNDFEELEEPDHMLGWLTAKESLPDTWING